MELTPAILFMFACGLLGLALGYLQGRAQLIKHIEQTQAKSHAAKTLNKLPTL